MISVDAEKAVAKYYRNNGYEVININPPMFILNRFEDDAERKSLGAEITEKFHKAEVCAGAPDLLVFDAVQRDTFDWDITELFFVEVKTKNDDFRARQLEWIRKNDVECKLALVRGGEFDIIDLQFIIEGEIIE